MKKKFIGKLNSSCATITLNTILSLEFSAETEKFRGYKYDSNNLNVLYKKNMDIKK